MTNAQIAESVEALMWLDTPGDEIDDWVSREVGDDPVRLREIGELILKRSEAYLAEAARRRKA